jgi:hypothetical protein
LHLRGFYDIKNERGHKVYKWAREFAFAGINHPNQIMKQTLGALEKKLLDSLLKKSPEKILSDGDWEYKALMDLLQLQAKNDHCMELRKIGLESNTLRYENDSIGVATSLNNIAGLLYNQGKHAEALCLSSHWLLDVKHYT